MKKYKINSVKPSDDCIFCNNPIIIVLGDIHLGAGNNRNIEFLVFLKSINEKKNQEKLRNLKVILIVGDFFDVFYGSYDNITQIGSLAHQIYDEMNIIKSRGIIIVETLGNHEVSYLGSFKENKTKFLINLNAHFEKNDIESSFITEDNVCQFIILKQAIKTNSISEKKKRFWVLELYDESLENNHSPSNCIYLNNLEPNIVNDNSYLFIHGHQFTPLLSKLSCKLFWDKELSKIDKKQVNFDHLNEKNNFFHSFKNSKFYKKLVMKPLFKYTSSKIPKFIEKYKLSKQRIRYVFYGHYHALFKSTLRKKRIEVYNTGGGKK